MNRDEFRWGFYFLLSSGVVWWEIANQKKTKNLLTKKGMYNDEGKIIMEAEFMLQITTFPFYLKMGKSRGRLEPKKKL